MMGELNTEKGLKYFTYGFILYMISLAVLLIMLIAFISMLPSMISDADDVQADDILAPLLGLAAGMCLGIIVIFIALIFFLLGLVSLNSGKMEFGEAHSNSYQKGIILIIVSIVVGIFGGIAGQVGAAVVGIFTAIMMALGLIYLIQEIADEQGQKLLWTAGILYIIISVVSAIVNIWLFYSLGLADIGTGTEPVAEDAMANALSALMIPLAIGSLALIPILIFFLAYRRTYMRVKNREIQPVPMPTPFGAPFPPPAPYPPYPGYPPQAPYPPYPGYPPQQPPPQYPPQQGGPPQHYPPQQDIGIKPMQTGPPPTVSPIATEVRRCVYCGSGVPKGAANCPACGKPV
jgi:hypothetical protein